MDELFRFSFTRPPDRTNAETLSLARKSRFQTGPKEPAPPGLEYIALHSKNKWPEFERASLTYVRSKPVKNFISHLATDSFIADLRGFADLIGGSSKKQWMTLTKKLATTLKEKGVDREFGSLEDNLADLFLALLILRSGGPTHLQALIRARRVPPSIADMLLNRPTLGELALQLRLVNLVRLILQDPSPVSTAENIENLLSLTLLLPPKIFASFVKPVHAVGVTELLVVKQHILRYELGEIARIENIMKGETRDHTSKHTLSNERETVFQTETDTQTEQELSATDHVKLNNEIDTVLKEETKVDAGLHAQYSGFVDIQTDLTVAYDRASSESKKSASEIAKDITQKAAKRVSERVSRSERTRILETFEETEGQNFKNNKQTNASGIYQWVEKVYLAQVFNYGNRLLFDLMVPEPAASLLSADETQIKKRPIPPDPLGTIKLYPAGSPHAGQPILDEDGNKQLDQPLRPDQLVDEPATSPFYYGRWVAMVHALSVDPPPSKSTVLSKAYSYPYTDDQMIAASEVIQIEDGYEALGANVAIVALTNDNSKHHVKESYNVNKEISYVGVSVSDQQRVYGKWVLTDNKKPRRGTKYESLTFPSPQAKSVPISILSADVNEFTVNIEILCQRTESAMAKWRLQTYEKIATAWQKLYEDYLVKAESQRMKEENTGVLGMNPAEINRKIERDELKRSCIAILDNKKLTGYDQIDELPQGTLANPRIDSPTFFDDASWVRWFEQAFEWDKMSYVFYPYYWGRSTKWVDRLQRKYGSDPLFENFLKAGYARVVIPVRNSFRSAVNFYLATGRPWMGGDLPSVGDKTYLPITEEIKEQTGAPGDERAVGDPWEIRIPTRLMKLRQDNKLPPDWEWLGNSTSFPVGPWSWKSDSGG